MKACVSGSTSRPGCECIVRLSPTGRHAGGEHHHSGALQWSGGKQDGPGLPSKGLTQRLAATSLKSGSCGESPTDAPI